APRPFELAGAIARHRLSASEPERVDARHRGDVTRDGVGAVGGAGVGAPVQLRRRQIAERDADPPEGPAELAGVGLELAVHRERAPTVTRTVVMRRWLFPDDA